MSTTASRVDAILAICSSARRERLGTNSFERTIQPKYGVFTYTQIWFKKVPYAEVEIFSGICGIRAAL